MKIGKLEINWRNKEPKSSFVNVSRYSSSSSKSAMKLSAVYRCVNVLSESVAQLPLDVFWIDKDGYKESYRNHPAYTLLREEPNPDMSRFTFMKTLVSQVVLNGNGYAYIERDNKGNAVSLRYIPSPLVSIVYVDTHQGQLKMYQVTGFNNLVEPYDMIHVLNFSYDGVVGVSTLTHARETIRLSHNANEYASGFFENGGSVSGILTVADARLKPGQSDAIRQTWKQQFDPTLGNAGGVAVLDGNMKYQPISINPADAQMLESREFQVVDICRFFGVSPVKAFDLNKASYSTVEATQLAFLTDTLAPILENIEGEFKRKVFRPSEKPHIEIKFDTSTLLRADKTAQSNYFQKLFQTGSITPNEIRKQLDMPKIEGGDKPFVPVNMQPPGSFKSEE